MCNDSFTDASRDLPKGLTLLLLSGIGLFGNICTIVLVLSFKKKHVPDILVLSLAFLDTYTVLIPIAMALISYFIPIRYPRSNNACEAMSFFSLLSRVMSMFLYTLIGIDRLWAISMPLVYQRRSKIFHWIIIIIILFFVSFAFSVVPWIYDATLDPSSQCSYYMTYSFSGFCILDYLHHYSYFLLILGWGQMIIFFFVFITTLSYIIMYWRRRTNLLHGINDALNKTVYEQKKKDPKTDLIKNITKLGSKLKEKKLVEWLVGEFGYEAQFVLMLFLVSILFYITWAPTLVIIIVMKIIQPDLEIDTRARDAIFWGIRLSIINIVSNPIIYAICVSTYRRAYFHVLKKLCCFCCREKFVRPAISPFDRDGELKEKKKQLLGTSTSSEVLEGGDATQSAGSPQLVNSFSANLHTQTIVEDNIGEIAETFDSPSLPKDSIIETGTSPILTEDSGIAEKVALFEDISLRPRKQQPKSQALMTKRLSETQSPKDQI